MPLHFRRKKPGARFTKHLKPKIFLSAIQICMALKKILGLRCLVKRAPELQTALIYNEAAALSGSTLLAL